MRVDFKEEAMKVETSDGCQEMEFGIRSCDVGFIMQLLRNDMYKYPIDAICREIASNSRDANREVGKSDTPIEIAIAKNPFLDSEFSISFSDVGPGISPDRMQNVFLNYGASTKRDTDEQTGGFGLGAKTPFAYTNTFCIETIFDCKKYIYVAMVKSGNKGRMYLMSEEECFDEYGTVISVPIKEEDIGRFEHAAYRATYFWDTRPTYINFTTLREVNEYETLLETEDFTVVAEHTKRAGIDFVRNSRVVALLDGIPYEIDNPEVGTFAINSAIHNLQSSNISILVMCHVGVGDVTISPNRENLQYNDKTLKKIKEILALMSDTIRKKGLEIAHRTTTVIDRHLFMNFLKSQYMRVSKLECRPFDQFTESELSMAYLGYRLSAKEEDPFDLSINGVRVDVPFSKLLPGLSLSRISKDTYGFKSKFRKDATETGLEFFDLDLFLMDTGKNARRDRTYYEQHQKDMLVIEPSEIYLRYKELSLENKKVFRKDYLDVKRSLKRLKEYGLGHYQLYSSIRQAKVVRKKRHEFKMFPIRYYRASVESYAVKEIKDGHLSTNCGRSFKIADSFYVPMKDLRLVKEFQSDAKLAFFKAHFFLKHNNRPRIVYVNEKYAHHLQGARSIYDVLSRLTQKQRQAVVDSVYLMSRRLHWLNHFEGLRFSSQKYSTAFRRLKAASRDADSLERFRDEIPYHFRNQMEDLSDLVESIKVMEEARSKFMMLTRGPQDKDERRHYQKYIDTFEQELIEKGEIV